MSKTLQITELDYDAIKSNLIDFMKGDSTFKDYDFEASGLNTLVSLLAANTHYMSYYMNMMSNEMFLDSAKLRDNVVSHAKLLNYVPKSHKAPKALLGMEIRGKTEYDTNTVQNPIKITRGVTFSSTLDNVEYIFTPTNPRILEKSHSEQLSNGRWINVYTIDDLVVQQGVVVHEDYTVDKTNINQRFVLSNSNVDTSTLKVFVRSNADDENKTEFKQSNDNMRLTGESNVYFVQESRNGKYEIVFGDDIIGKSVDTGNVISVSYLVTAGAAANGISTFNLKTNSESDVYTISNVYSVNSSFGGGDQESIESIKHYAPKVFEGQNRAVTVRDYKSIIPTVYPQASSINVWGGEDNIPPHYGRVYISIKPDNGFYLSDYEKDSIALELKKNYSVVSVIPTIVDPDYTRIKIVTNVKYDDEATIKSQDELKSEVQNFIINFNTKYLNEFDNYFRYSNFVRQLDDVDMAITNNETFISLMNEEEIVFDSKRSYTFNFNNKLRKGTLKSNGFNVAGSVYTWYAEEDSTYNGSLKFYAYDIKDKKIYSNILKGTIDYATGTITFKDFIITDTEDGSDFISIEVSTLSLDIFPRRNQILLMYVDDCEINMLPDTDDFNNNYDITTQQVNILKPA
jgi:hypothetical protein